jgi:lysosomal alpha-glucosidase
LPRDRLFGGGEHVSSFMLKKGRYSMWARGQDSPIADLETGKGNLYGVHPFVMGQQKDKTKFFGIFFMNSNAQEFDVEFLSGNEAGLTYRTTGGILDMYFFVNKGANEIVALYNNIVGKPLLPPFWSLGFQQAAWPYNSTDDL